MKANGKNIFTQNKAFLIVAAATILLLLIPLTLMLLKIPLYDPGSGYELINWTLADFIVMGSLIFGAGSLFVILTRKWPKRRVIIGIILLTLFLYAWAELAVGVFTNIGN